MILSGPALPPPQPPCPSSVVGKGVAYLSLDEISCGLIKAHHIHWLI